MSINKNINNNPIINVYFIILYNLDNLKKMLPNYIKTQIINSAKILLKMVKI